MESKEEKFRKTVGEHKKKILSICRYYAPTVEDQKDMYQEILINIWRSLESFRGDSGIGTWIYRIAVNTSLSYAGKQYKRMKLNVDIENTNLRLVVSDEADDAALREEQFQILQAKLNQLNFIDKAIMGLLLEDLSTREISDIIGITEPNVRVKIHRIKENLRNQMKGGNHE
jgi:RNA polymerase sigma-70 factor, ECF subfamily